MIYEYSRLVLIMRGIQVFLAIFLLKGVAKGGSKQEIRSLARKLPHNLG